MRRMLTHLIEERYGEMNTKTLDQRMSRATVRLYKAELLVSYGALVLFVAGVLTLWTLLAK